VAFGLLGLAIGLAWRGYLAAAIGSASHARAVQPPAPLIGEASTSRQLPPPPPSGSAATPVTPTAPPP
jgi:hypothetical protein